MDSTELILLAFATLMIGGADVYGGYAARTSHPLSVAAWSQAAGIPILIVAAVIVGGTITTRDLGLGAVAGVGSAVGVGALYRGFAVSSVGIVAPVAATTAAIVPIVVGLVGGERPSTIALVGLAVALVAVFLVSYLPGQRDHAIAAVIHGAVSGVGFGVMVIAYAATSTDSGVWSAVAGRTVAALVAGLAVVAISVDWRIASSVRFATVMAGVLAAAGMAAFVTASQTSDLVVLGVVLGLMPTTTVVLASIFLDDRLIPTQWIGIALAAVAVAMISVG